MFSVRYFFRTLPVIVPVFPNFSTTASIFFTPDRRALSNSSINSLSSILLAAQHAKTKGSPENSFHSRARSILYLKLFSYSKHWSPIRTTASFRPIFKKSNPSEVLIHLNSFFQLFFARTFERFTEDRDR